MPRGRKKVYLFLLINLQDISQLDSKGVLIIMAHMLLSL
jgi:hypothetical protein